MNGGVLLSSRLAGRVKELASRPLNPAGPRAPGVDAGIELHPVKITSTTLTDDRYPGTLYVRDAGGDDFAQLGEDDAIWVDTPNGETLGTGTYYWAKLTGKVESDGKPVYEVVGTITEVSAFSGASVWLNSTQSVTTGSAVAIQWTHEAWDADSYWDAGTPDRLVIRQTGDYVVMAGLAWSGGATNRTVGHRAVVLRGTGDIVHEVNGQARAIASTPAATFDSSGNPQEDICCQFVAMEVRVVTTPTGATTYVQAFAQQNSGSNQNVFTLGDARTWMTIRKR